MALEQSGNAVGDVVDVVGCLRMERHLDVVFSCPEDGAHHIRVVGETSYMNMTAVCYDGQDMFQDDHEVALIEALHSCLLFRFSSINYAGALLEDFLQDIQSELGYTSHRVLESPDDGMDEEVQISLFHSEDEEETFPNKAQDKLEEVHTVFWE